MPADPPYELTPEAHHAESFQAPERTEWLLSQQRTLKELQLASLDMEDGCSQLDAKWGNLNSTRYSCACKSCADGARAPDGQPQPGPWLDEYTQRVELAMVSW